MHYIREIIIIILLFVTGVLFYSVRQLRYENANLRLLATELENDLYDAQSETAVVYDLLKGEQLLVAELTDSIATLLVQPDVSQWEALSDAYLYTAADEGRELEALLSGEAQKKLYQLQESYAWQYTALKEWIRACCNR